MVYRLPQGKCLPSAADATALGEAQRVAYWKFIAGALFFSACSLLPTLLQG